MLIMGSFYVANMSAFRMYNRNVLYSPIESVEDLAWQTKVKYGALRGGTTESFFRNSSVNAFQKMWSSMKSSYPSEFINSTSEGVGRVLHGSDDFAFLMEATSIEYITERYCNLTQIGNTTDLKGYGIAIRTSKLSTFVNELRYW